jgi:CheY-like chemotaxis protein
VADSDRLSQVVTNLLSNAVKFTDEGTVTVAIETQGSNLLVRVIDTGSGISEADQKLVFEKYRQVGDVITDKPQGTGLGLPISKEIVEHHGGRLWVESKPGEGSCFAFSIPLADVPQTLQEPISFNELVRQLDRLRWAPREGHQVILVVDDEAPIRQVLRQSLEAEGHKVLEAEDGLTGLSTAREERPDLIILDVMMPQLNGFDVAAALKNDPDFMGIPIIMLTVVDDAQRAYGLGVDRYISKPFEPQDIVSEVEALIETRTEPASVLLLGDLGDRLEALREAVIASAHQLHIAADLQDLTQLAEAHSPSLVILSGEEFQDAGGVDRVQAALGSHATLTRTLAPQG